MASVNDYLREFRERASPEIAQKLTVIEDLYTKSK